MFPCDAIYIYIEKEEKKKKVPHGYCFNFPSSTCTRNLESKIKWSVNLNALAYMIMAIAEEISFLIHSFCGYINSSAGNQ